MLCQYNNIYEGSYKYLKEKKVQTKDWKEKNGGKGKVTKPKILFITLFISLFTLFIYRKKEHESMTEKK